MFGVWLPCLRASSTASETLRCIPQTGDRLGSVEVIKVLVSSCLTFLSLKLLPDAFSITSDYLRIFVHVETAETCVKIGVLHFCSVFNHRLFPRICEEMFWVRHCIWHVSWRFYNLSPMQKAFEPFVCSSRSGTGTITDLVISLAKWLLCWGFASFPMMIKEGGFPFLQILCMFGTVYMIVRKDS